MKDRVKRVDVGLDVGLKTVVILVPLEGLGMFRVAGIPIAWFVVSWLHFQRGFSFLKRTGGQGITHSE